MGVAFSYLSDALNKKWNSGDTILISFSYHTSIIGVGADRSILCRRNSRDTILISFSYHAIIIDAGVDQSIGLQLSIVSPELRNLIVFPELNNRRRRRKPAAAGFPVALRDAAHAPPLLLPVLPCGD